MSKELLDLTTIVDRPTVRITSRMHPAGKSYEVLAPNELSLFQFAGLEAKAATLSGLDLTKKPTPAQERAHRNALLSLVATVAPSIEDKVRTGLSDMQLLAIYGAFSGTVEGGDEGNAPSGQTSAAPLPNSKPSTAATRKRGSTTRSGS